jgi:hypothetical protein
MVNLNESNKRFYFVYKKMVFLRGLTGKCSNDRLISLFLLKRKNRKKYFAG